MIKSSKLVEEMDASPTLGIAGKAKALKAAGEDVISLSAGEPDFSSPDGVRAAVVAALKNPKESGIDSYTAVSGLPSLRETIARRYGGRAENVIVTVGGKESLYLSLLCTMNQGDTLAFAAPYWNSYKEMAHLVGAKLLVIDTGKECKLTFDAFFRGVKGREVKVVLLNSPSNPTGKVIEKVDLERITKYCMEQDIVILSDEVYEPFVYGKQHYSPLMVEGADQYSIVSSAVSKMYAMTGWRCGWIYGPRHVIKAANKVKGNTTSNVTVAAQIAAEEALRSDSSFIAVMRDEFQKRQEYVVGALNAIEGIVCDKPEGAFYVFPNISSFGLSSEEFATRLLGEKKVALVHGSAFGAEGFVRISYATSMDNLKRAIERISDFVSTL